jgi:subtilisin family serine protease
MRHGFSAPCAVRGVEDNQNLTPDNDPRLIEALRGLNSLDASTPDELTRRRHLAQMRRARSGARVQRLVGVAAALALLAGGFAVARGGSSNNSSNTPAAQEDVELPELRPVTDLTPVPFERTEQYVILDVSAKRASAVSQELSAALGSEPAVVGKDKSSTTFVVPASAVSKLSDTSGITATADSPVKSTAEQTPVPSWGLDRIDATDIALNNSYKYVSTGTSSYVYVIDTGVYSGHSDLSGRVTPGYSAVSDGNGSEDCNGHGTHVAGTIAGTKYGVAKSTRIVAVRVLDCNGSGYSSSVVAGINWVVQSHPGGSGIINMSLGGGANSAIDTAVADATAAGLTVVVAAGNSSADACSYSPARAPSAITIGAIDRTDARASYSNFGSCVDVWAPGTGITSSWIGGASATNTISGTSMASPHVAGLAARLAQAFPGISNSEIVSKLTANSTTALPVTTFVEQEVPVTTTTAPDIATTTVPEGTTTTTAAPVVTVAPTTTTAAPAPTTTTTVKPIKRPVKKREIVQPKNFSLRSKIESNTLVVTAAWFDDGSPESYRIECINKGNSRLKDDASEAELSAETAKALADTVLNVERNAVTTAPNGRTETVLTLSPPTSSRCWIVAVVDGESGKRSNVAVTPKFVRIPETTTTTTVAQPNNSPVTTATPVTEPGNGQRNSNNNNNNNSNRSQDTNTSTSTSTSTSIKNNNGNNSNNGNSRR